MEERRNSRESGSNERGKTARGRESPGEMDNEDRRVRDKGKV